MATVIPTIEQLITTYGKKIPGECANCIRKRRASQSSNCWLIEVDDKTAFTVCSWCDVEDGQRWLW